MIVIVGGHSRKIGKTSVITGLIAALPAPEWTAVKISANGNGSGSNGSFLLTEEEHPGRQRPLLVFLLNDEILARHPYAAKAKKDTLAVTIDEFSEIKTQVARTLLVRLKDSGSPPT